MTGQSDKSRAHVDAGLVEHLRLLFAAVLGYIRARIELVALESREAAGHYLIILALAVAAVGAVIFGYLFLCIAVVFGVAMLTGWAWPWIMLAVALLHLGGALAAVLIARERVSDPMFRATLNEFRKDQQWLTSTTTPAEKQS